MKVTKIIQLPKIFVSKKYICIKCSNNFHFLREFLCIIYCYCVVSASDETYHFFNSMHKWVYSHIPLFGPLQVAMHKDLGLTSLQTMIEEKLHTGLSITHQKRTKNPIAKGHNGKKCIKGIKQFVINWSLPM